MNTNAFRTESEILDRLDDVRLSPTDQGVLEAIVVRPHVGLRQMLDRCMLSPEGGTEGDRWRDNCWRTLEDGRADPDVQICIMNCRMIQLLAGEKERWAMAGDNLFVDLDLSRENLATGQRLSIGECILEITEQAHNGCAKFKERYGAAALQVVNSVTGKKHRLRGIYAKVINAGFVQVGDRITKV